MPEIARFYGIIIRIFFESGRYQLPHIHAAYKVEGLHMNSIIARRHWETSLV